MNEIVQAISTVGFPIVCCIGLAWFCRSMIEQQNKNVERMFEMYQKSNNENREAIEACTRAVEKLCDKIDKED